MTDDEIRAFWAASSDEPLPIRMATSAGGTTVVLANLLRPLLLELARTMPCAPGHLLAGGLLGEEVDEVAGAFGDRFGLRERNRRARGEWAAVWLAAP